MKNKIFLKTFVSLLVILGVFSLSSYTSAKTLDPRCFTKTACHNQWQINGSSKEQAKENNAFYSKGKADSVCLGELNGKELGFCRPATSAETEVSFAGKDEFGNIAQFIRYMYDWSMVAGAVLAVLVILGSGIQIAVSGGRSNMIKTAKGRITSALAGIVLLVGSFTILDTINPALVNLRLPQVWLIRQVEMQPQWCSEVEGMGDKAKFALAIKKDQKKSKKKKRSELEKKNFKYTVSGTKATKCGNEYYPRGKSGQTCTGDYCPNKKICGPYIGTVKDDVSLDKGPNNKKPGCAVGDLAMVIKPGGNQLYKTIKARQMEAKGAANWLIGEFAEGPALIASNLLNYYLGSDRISPKGWLLISSENDGWIPFTNSEGAKLIPVCKTSGKKRVLAENPVDAEGEFGQSLHTKPTTYIITTRNKKQALNNKCQDNTGSKAAGFIFKVNVEEKNSPLKDLVTGALLRSLESEVNASLYLAPETEMGESKVFSLTGGSFSKFIDTKSKKVDSTCTGSAGGVGLGGTGVGTDKNCTETIEYYNLKNGGAYFSIKKLEQRKRVGKFNFTGYIMENIN